METLKYIFQVEPREICYLSVIIGSYDGMAMVKTIDPHKAIIELRISPGCEDAMLDLLKYLERMEGIIFTPKTRYEDRGH